MIARLALLGTPKTLNCSCADTRYRQTVRTNALDIGLYRLTIPSGGGPLKGDRPDRLLNCDAINHGGDNGGFSLQGRRVVGTSNESISKAISRAISKAGATLRHLGWFEVVQIRGSIENDQIRQYQVTVKVGFTLEED
jgi:dodecin